MTHKEFILETCKGILREIGVKYDDDDESDSADLLSPTASITPVVERFSCKGEHRGSIARSKLYK